MAGEGTRQGSHVMWGNAFEWEAEFLHWETGSGQYVGHHCGGDIILITYIYIYMYVYVYAR